LDVFEQGSPSTSSVFLPTKAGMEQRAMTESLG